MKSPYAYPPPTYKKADAKMKELCGMVLSLKNKTGQRPITPPFHRLTVLFNKTAIKCANKEFYEDDIRKSGWCFTCVDEAKEGEPGFCSQEVVLSGFQKIKWER